MRRTRAVLLAVGAAILINIAPLGAQGRSVEQTWEFTLDPEATEPAGSYEVKLALGDSPATEAALRRWLYEGLEPLAWAATQAQDWGEDYREEARELMDSLEDETFLGNLNYYQFEGTEVVAELPQLIVVSRFFEDYRGGAHGNHGQSFVLIDPDRGPVDESLVSPDFWATLSPWVEDELRRQYDLPADEPLDSQGTFFDAHPEAPSELAPTPDGLVLVWNPYEISPYVVGVVEVVVPWDVAEAVIAPWAQARLTPWLR